VDIVPGAASDGQEPEKPNCGLSGIPQCWRPSEGTAMVVVTSADLQKQFGRYRELALKEPVTVTHRGRESLVVMSAAEFKRLRALDTRNTNGPNSRLVGSMRIP
jgi:prevent-host-death family protein